MASGDLEFGLNIQTSVDPVAMTQEQAETEVLGEFGEAGRFGELKTEAGRASFNAAVQERLRAANLAAPPTPPPFEGFDVGTRASFSTPGTPYLGSRYVSPEAKISAAEARSLGIMAPPDVPEFREGGDWWSAHGSVDAGRIWGDTFEDTSAPWYQGGEESAAAEAAAAASQARSLGIDWGAMGGRFRRGVTSHSAQFGLGFGAMQLGGEMSSLYAADNSGRYVSPEQRATNAAGLLSGVGAIGGTLIGAAFGNPILGGFIGQGVGSAAQGVIGANDERQQSTRETAERLAASLGGAADTVDRFKSLIEATGAPVQQLGQGLAALQGLSPGVGADAITGAGRMALAEGSRFQEITQGVGGFLAGNPALYGATAAFATSGGAISGGDYRAIGQYALFSGDIGAYNAAQGGAAAARYSADPTASRLAGELAGEQGSWRRQAEHFVTNIADHLTTGSVRKWFDDSDAIDLRQSQVDARRKALDGRAADTDAQDLALSQTYGEARFGLARSQAQTALGQSGFDLARLTGAGASELSGLIPGIARSLAGRVSADRTFITQAQSAVSGLDPKDPVQASLIQGYQQDILKSQIDASQAPLLEAQMRRDDMQQGLQERASSFSLRNLRDTLGGVSNAAQAQGDLAYYRGLTSEARSLPYLSPTERDQLTAQGLQGAYQVRMGVDAQNLAGIDLGMDRAQTGLARARIAGGPEDVYQAGQGVADAYTAKIRELTNELQRGGLTLDDRIAKERQLTEVQRSSDAFGFQRQEDRFTDRASVIGTDIDAASVGMGRTLARGGNAALDPSLLSLTLSAQTTAQGKLDFDRLHFPGNKQLLASDRLGVAQAQEGRDRFLDAYNTYRPDGAFSRRMMDDEAAQQIAQVLPFSDGVDPMSANRRLTADFRQDLTQLNANRADRQRRGLWRDEDETGYDARKNADDLQIARLGHDDQRAWLSMLPETVAGMPLDAGVARAVLPDAALAAYYSPSGVNGSFGPAGSMALSRSLGIAPHAMLGGMAGTGAAATHPALAAAGVTSHGGSPIDYNPRGHHYSSDPASHEYIGIVTPGMGRQYSSDPRSQEYSGILTGDNGHHYSSDPRSQEFMGMVPGVSSAFFAPPPRVAAGAAGPSVGSGSMSMAGMRSDAAPSRRAEDLLEQVVRILSSIERTGARFSATPPGNTVGAAVQIGSQSRNPYTGR